MRYYELGVLSAICKRVCNRFWIFAFYKNYCVWKILLVPNSILATTYIIGGIALPYLPLDKYEKTMHTAVKIYEIQIVDEAITRIEYRVFS
ncbi:hypothetical protein [Marinifilum fragile]|uniref:hypothetical protein n=1 Tax=Marinifilum fragile TaxID=570161 RepID=UPI002AAB8E40|nr:hypothetical protein [Marinifilum fragile]